MREREREGGRGRGRGREGGGEGGREGEDTGSGTGPAAQTHLDLEVPRLHRRVRQRCLQRLSHALGSDELADSRFLLLYCSLHGHVGFNLGGLLCYTRTWSARGAGNPQHLETTRSQARNQAQRTSTSTSMSSAMAPNRTRQAGGLGPAPARHYPPQTRQPFAPLDRCLQAWPCLLRLLRILTPGPACASSTAAARLRPGSGLARSACRALIAGVVDTKVSSRAWISHTWLSVP